MGTEKHTEEEWNILAERLKTGSGPSGEHFISDLKATAEASLACATCPPASTVPVPVSASATAVDLDPTKGPGDNAPANPPPPRRRPRGNGGSGGKGNGGTKGASGDSWKRFREGASAFFKDPLVRVIFVVFIAWCFSSWLYRTNMSPESLREARLLNEEANKLKDSPKASPLPDITKLCEFTKERRERESIYFPGGCRTIALDPDPQHPEIYLKMKQRWSLRGSYAIYTYVKDEVRSNAKAAVEIPVLFCQTRTSTESKYSGNNCAGELATLNYPANVSVQFDTPLIITR